jgi:hypothetical protein
VHSQGPIKSHPADPSGAAWTADTSTQGHWVNRKHGSDHPDSHDIFTIVTVARAAHGGLASMALEDLEVRSAGVLHTAIGMNEDRVPIPADGNSIPKTMPFKLDAL